MAGMGEGVNPIFVQYCGTVVEGVNTIFVNCCGYGRAGESPISIPRLDLSYCVL